MAARQSTIREWIERGQEKGASHLVVWVDTFDWEDYPVFCDSVEDARREHKRSGDNMQRVEEVYNLNGDIEEQLAMHRCFEF